MEWYEKYAERVEVSVNDELKDVILDGLEFNHQNYGAKYCPCIVAKSKDTICPCKTMRETKVCHCQLFIN